MPRSSSLSSRPSSSSPLLKRRHESLSNPPSTPDPPRKKSRSRRYISHAVDNHVYQEAGKRAACLLDPFVHPSVAFRHGMGDGTTAENSNLPPGVLKRSLAVYEGLLSYIPGLRNRLGSLRRSGELKRISGLIWTGISAGRSQDFGAVKHQGLKYITPTINGTLNPPFTAGPTKSDRGFHHPLTARLLCPRSERDAFDANPDEVQRLLLTGKIMVSYERMPSYLYPESVYDARDPRVGLFRSDILVRFYRHLYVGPKAAITGALVGSQSKPSKNLAYELDEVSYRSIAWVAVVIYYTLSTAETWTDGVVGSFDLDMFFGLIISLFEDENDPWVRETMRWWNVQIFGSKFAKATKASFEAPLSGSNAIKVLQATGQREADAFPLDEDASGLPTSFITDDAMSKRQSAGNSSPHSLDTIAAMPASSFVDSEADDLNTTSDSDATYHKVISTAASCSELNSTSRGPSRVHKFKAGS